MSQVRSARQNVAIEWGYSSGKTYADAFNDVEMDVVFRHSGGGEWRVPCYWAGEQEWRVRFAPPEPGSYTYRSMCSDAGNADLHGVDGRLEATPYDGQNPILRHGPLRVSADHRYLEHRDGAPFFWLGDTWWMALARRLGWPDDFQTLAAHRVAQGFTLIQIVAGPHPDMPAFDPRNANEAGQPWEEGWARINPAFYDVADLKMQWLVRSGLVPCILACWGYYLPWMGVEKLKQHWRYLVARYGAYPVVWCLAGEATMPWYLSADREADARAQRQGWTEVGRYLRSVDPYGHPITIHPTVYGRDQVNDESVLDLDMLQTGHGGHPVMLRAAALVQKAVARQPKMPVVNGEVCYEGNLETARQEVQRFLFWSNFLSGVAGFTYGANGIFQFNSEGEVFGPSPHGGAWGNMLWREAYRWPGATQIAIGKRLLERFEWWRLEPHQEWVEPCAAEPDYFRPYAAGIPGKLRLVYLPGAVAPWSAPVHVKRLEAGVAYSASFFDPTNGREHPIGRVTPDASGSWRIPTPPIIQDWVVVLERE